MSCNREVKSYTSFFFANLYEVVHAVLWSLNKFYAGFHLV